MIEILEEELFLGKSGRLAWVGDSLVKHVMLNNYLLFSIS
jgi:hypothetical protein